MNRPVGSLGLAELGDADGFGFRGLGEEVVDDAGFAVGLELGLLPFAAVGGEFDLVLARVVSTRFAGVENEASDVSGLREVDLEPHVGALRIASVPAGGEVAVDGFGDFFVVVTGGEFPRGAV